MPCYHPLAAWYAKDWNPESGKRPITFDVNLGFKDRPVSVPCGRCIGCRLERARVWAVRCMHEASLWDSNLFVTLTYDDDCVPRDGTLRPEDMVKFLKRLRFFRSFRRLNAKTNRFRRVYPPLRYLQCGEYGETTFRPHHHALLFNCDFDDKRRVRIWDSDNPVWESQKLNELWGFGSCKIGSVSFESAGYVARYALKKVIGDGATDWYAGRIPEYMTMSRRPGIGDGWFRKYGSQVYPRDELVVNGKRCKSFRFYDDRYSKVDPVSFKEVKMQRRLAAVSDVDSTGKRLIVREIVKESAIALLTRDLEA